MQGAPGNPTLSQRNHPLSVSPAETQRVGVSGFVAPVCAWRRDLSHLVSGEGREAGLMLMIVAERRFTFIWEVPTMAGLGGWC